MKKILAQFKQDLNGNRELKSIDLDVRLTQNGFNLKVNKIQELYNNIKE